MREGEEKEEVKNSSQLGGDDVSEIFCQLLFMKLGFGFSSDVIEKKCTFAAAAAASSSETVNGLKSATYSRFARHGTKKSPTNNCSGEFDPSSATKVLQACIYMSVYSGLFLKSLVASSIVKVDGLTLIFTFKYKVIKLSSMRIRNWTILVAKS